MKKRNNIEKWLLLSWKRVAVIVAMWFIAVILHNAIYGIFLIEEPVLFIFAVIILPIYFLISIIYTVIKLAMRKSRKL